MAGIRGGANANKPCPVCLVDGEDMAKFLQQYVMRTTEEAKWTLENARKHSSKEQQTEVLKETGLRAIDNAFWDIKNSDPYRALSWDRLHSYPSGIGRHLMEELTNVRFNKFEGTDKRLLKATVEKR